jgi:hypothetical protein
LFENNETNGYTLYPNPVHSKLYIRFDELRSAEVEIKIFDLLGKVLLENKIESIIAGSEHNIDIHHFKEGIYFVQIKSNGASYNQQFIKH